MDLCVICTTELKTLQKRLQKRSYAPEKLRENLDSEIFRICQNEATEAGHKILILDTSKSQPAKHLKTILDALDTP